MRRSALAGLTAVVLTAGTLLGAGAPAQAANSTVLYAGTAGPTTVVAAPGQTVQLAGTYSQPNIIASSGTADQPITIRPAITGATLVGSTVGFVVNGQHDIVIQGFTLNNEVTAPAVDLSNASGITVRNVRATMGSGVTVPAFRLVAVTGSSLIQVSGGGPQLPGGVSLDAASTGDTSPPRASSPTRTPPAPASTWPVPATRS